MVIRVTNVHVHNNPSEQTQPFEFEIIFSCSPPGICEELEWRLIYVGSADDANCDQELESILVGPVAIGHNKVTFEAPAPDLSRIPNLLDNAVILLSGQYKEQEFIRIGYYVRNKPIIDFPIDDKGEPIQPTTILPNELRRHILANDPRVTLIQIPWDSDDNELMSRLQPELEQETAAILQRHRIHHDPSVLSSSSYTNGTIGFSNTSAPTSIDTSFNKPVADDFVIDDIELDAIHDEDDEEDEVTGEESEIDLENDSEEL